MIHTYDLSIYYTDNDGIRQVRDFINISRVARDRYIEYFDNLYPGLGTRSSKVKFYYTIRVGE